MTKGVGITGFWDAGQRILEGGGKERRNRETMMGNSTKYQHHPHKKNPV